jgi:outer membrane protein W
MNFTKQLLSLATYFFISLMLIIPICARDVILEFKAAYFLPTDSVFKQIYHNGSALCGPEVTFQLCNNKNWYGFASIDYFQKKGHSIGLCDFTKVSLLPFGVGLKYFVPILCDRADFYIGLGFQPVYVRTENCVECVSVKQSRWGFGGIGKVGTYWYLPRNFVIDLFVDYSFVKVGCKNSCQLTPRKADVSGAIFGIGLGYRF